VGSSRSEMCGSSPMQSSEEQSSTRFSRNEKKVSIRILTHHGEHGVHRENLLSSVLSVFSVVKNYALPSTIASNAILTYNPYSI